MKNTLRSILSQYEHGRSLLLPIINLGKKMRVPFWFYYMILLTQLGYSQSLEFGPIHENWKIKSGYIKQVVTNSDGFSYLFLNQFGRIVDNMTQDNSPNKKLAIAEFSPELKLLRYNKLVFEDTEMRIKDSFVFNNMIYVHTSRLNNDWLVPLKDHYYAEYIMLFDLSGKLQKQVELFKVTKYVSSSSSNYISSISILPNEGNLFYYVYNKTHSPITVTYRTFDNSFQEVWIQKMEYGYKYKSIKKHTPSVIGNNLIVMIEIKKNNKERVKGQSDKKYILYIQPTDGDTKTIKSVEIIYQDRLVSQLQVVKSLNALNKQLEIIGTYHDDPKAMKGIVSTTLKIDNLTYSSVYTEIASKVIDQLPYSSKAYKKWKGIQHYSIMNIGIINGAYFLIFERNSFYKVSSTFFNYYGTSMGVGGASMNAMRSYYNLGDVAYSGEIIVVKFNSNKEMEWYKVIKKKQSSYRNNIHSMLSHRMLSTKYDLYFVYHIIESDMNIEQDSDIIASKDCRMKIAQLTTDGNLSSAYLTFNTDKNIVDNKRYYTYIQKGSNNIFYATSKLKFDGARSGSFRLIKLNWY